MKPGDGEAVTSRRTTGGVAVVEQPVEHRELTLRLAGVASQQILRPTPRFSASFSVSAQHHVRGHLSSPPPPGGHRPAGRGARADRGSTARTTAPRRRPPASRLRRARLRPRRPRGGRRRRGHDDRPGFDGHDRSTATGSIAENVDIGGGRSIYVECQGEGSPTVLLLSGGGTASDLWHAPGQVPNVYDTIGTQTRVCAWDRPGVQYLDGTPSRSTAVPQPITPQDAADDLTAILDKLDMHGPYVLAAHSFAGNIARVFAAEHPDDVKGIVFVDVLSPELRAQMTPEQWAIWVTDQQPEPGTDRGLPRSRAVRLQRQPRPGRGRRKAAARCRSSC